MRNYGAKPIIKLRTEATQTRMPNLSVLGKETKADSHRRALPAATPCSIALCT